MKSRHLATWLIVLATILAWSSTATAIGMLIPKGDGYKPLSIKYHRVQVTIKDGSAVTAVKQSFANNTSRVLEGTFYFPLPDGATLSDFALYMNGKRITGEVLEKKRARRIYESIVRKMKDPGLIEYLNRKLFKARIYPIPARGEMKVDISFTQVLPFNDGVYRYEYPMRGPGTTVTTMNDFTLDTKIHSKTPIKTVYSPSHKVYVKKKSDNLALASFEQTRLAFDKDFVLYYSVSKKAIGLNLLTYRPDGENGYFLLMASPKSKLRDKEIIGKGIVFVVDTSGSMSGEKMKRAKAALKYCLNKLNPKDWFNIVRFSSDVEKFEKWQVPANKHNIKRALKFANTLEAGGATAFSEVLSTALKVKGDRPHLVLFLTDGRPTIGETRGTEIISLAKKQNKSNASIFFFGVGDDINTHLLDTVASDHRGFSIYVKPNQDIELAVASFYNRVKYPVMANLKLDFGKVKTYSMVPNRVPDLFKGSQVIMMGRYRNSGHSSITLVGSVSGQKKKFVYEGVFPKSKKANSFIAKLWAHRHVGFLLDQIRLKGENSELKREVIQLAKRFGIVTPYTSYLVVEPKFAPRYGLRDGSKVLSGKGKDKKLYRPRRLYVVKRPRILAKKKRIRRFDYLGDNDAPSPSPSPSREPSVRPKNDAFIRRGWNKKSGRTGVRTAKKLRQLKTTHYIRPQRVKYRVRYVAGRQFINKSGVWTDGKYKSSLRTVRVKYLSTAYFNLLRAYPKLAPFLKLGSRVIVVYRSKAIIIGSSGKDNLTESQIRALVN